MIKFALQLFKFGALPLVKEGKLGNFKLGNHVIEIQLSSIFTATNVVSWMISSVPIAWRERFKCAKFILGEQLFGKVGACPHRKTSFSCEKHLLGKLGKCHHGKL